MNEGMARSEESTWLQALGQAGGTAHAPGFNAFDDPQPAAAAAAALELAYQDRPVPEAVRMLTAVLRGSQMGPGDGWFGPAEARYSWSWLAERHGVDPANGGIARSHFLADDARF